MKLFYGDDIVAEERELGSKVCGLKKRGFRPEIYLSVQEVEQLLKRENYQGYLQRLSIAHRQKGEK